MRRTPKTSKHWKVAAKAVAEYLGGQKRPVMLFSLTSVADAAAREVGRRSDLFESLFAYEGLLPRGWKGAWLGNGSGDSLYHAVPSGWTEGPVQPSLAASLMGSGSVRVVNPDAICVNDGGKPGVWGVSS